MVSLAHNTITYSHVNVVIHDYQGTCFVSLVVRFLSTNLSHGTLVHGTRLILPSCIERVPVVSIHVNILPSKTWREQCNRANGMPHPRDTDKLPPRPPRHINVAFIFRFPKSCLGFNYIVQTAAHHVPVAVLNCDYLYHMHAHITRLRPVLLKI